MKKQAPVDFSITSIHDSNKAYRTENIFLTNEFGILYDMSNIIHSILSDQNAEFPNNFVFKLNQPYRLKEGRIILAVRGQIKVRYNLIEYVIRPSQILVVSIGAIVQIVEVAPGTLLRMTGFGPNFIPFARKEEHLEYYWKSRQNLIIPLSESELESVERYFKLIWDTVQQFDELHRDIIQHLIVAFLQYINHVRMRYQNENNHTATHQDNIFNRFMNLVNTFSISERSVGFYADKLCLTPRYLNTVIRQVSGKTVMDWINQAVILEAKVLLKHNDLLTYQISDKLNFSNPSFFCKFFKRMTGMTPQEYQREE